MINSTTSSDSNEIEFRKAIVPEELDALVEFDCIAFHAYPADLFLRDACQGYETYWMVANGKLWDARRLNTEPMSSLPRRNKQKSNSLRLTLQQSQSAFQPNAEQAQTVQSDCRRDLRSESASLPGQPPFHF
jgi:hypothetical protein